MKTLANSVLVLFILGFSWGLCRLAFELAFNTRSIVGDEGGYRHGIYGDVCYTGCGSEIYNECIGLEGTGLKSCITIKDYEKLLKIK